MPEAAQSAPRPRPRLLAGGCAGHAGLRAAAGGAEAVRGRIGVVAREHEETEGVAAGRVMSAMVAMAAVAAMADRIVAGLQPLRAVPFGGYP